MHTTDCNATTFHHNGDYSGDVIVLDIRTRQEIRVPFDDIKTLVAKYVRDRQISRLEQISPVNYEEINRLEQAEPDEVLGLTNPQQGWS